MKSFISTKKLMRLLQGRFSRLTTDSIFGGASQVEVIFGSCAVPQPVETVAKDFPIARL
jgi:hypothetical protein